MECQVNCLPEDPDGYYSPRQVRIPYNAKTDEASWEDKPLGFPLDDFATGVALSGWNWMEKQSHWVGYDIDGADHNAGFTQEQLDRLIKVVKTIPWVNIRKSTGGKGYHFYVFLDPPVKTNNHTEHAALAKAILGQMCALTGHHISDHVDQYGKMLWIWHEKWERYGREEGGFELIHKAEENMKSDQVPYDWEAYIGVCQRKAVGFKPVEIQDIEELCTLSQCRLDDEHVNLIRFISERGPWCADASTGLVRTHTWILKEAHEQMNLRGFFDTSTTRSTEINCFMFPVNNGGWRVYRYGGPQVQEKSNWFQTEKHKVAYFNMFMPLPVAAKINDGVEMENGGFEFRLAEDAIKAAKLMGAEQCLLPDIYSRRRTQLLLSKKGKLIVKMAAETEHKDIEQRDLARRWRYDKKWWIRLLNLPENTGKEKSPEIIRFVISASGKVEWYLRDIQREDKWNPVGKSVCENALQHQGFDRLEAQRIVGSCALQPWYRVNKPFEPEYPGGQTWNIDASRFAYQPTLGDERHFQHWESIFDHIGSGLDTYIRESEWCRANHIYTGSDYLMTWIAYAFRRPTFPLPYLFLFGPQNCGKSIWHESIGMLLKRGYVRADTAIDANSNFNAEIEGSVFCSLDEKYIDAASRARVYGKIRDWVTSPQIVINAKYHTPFTARNTTHWVQCSNSITACPAFPGDTRIVMIKVSPLKKEIPKPQLLEILSKEASDFLGAVLDTELPPPIGRLALPVLDTAAKAVLSDVSEDPLSAFIREECLIEDGAYVGSKELRDKYIDWLSEVDHQLASVVANQSSTHFNRALQEIDVCSDLPQGYWSKRSDRIIGNMTLKSNPEKVEGAFYQCQIRRNNRLTLEVR